MGSMRELIRWIEENPAADLSAAALAKRCELSVRSLHRRFVLETGMTPARFVERMRVRAAQRMMATTQARPGEIAAACGFSSLTIMSRTFKRQLDVSAAAYRRNVFKRKRPS